MNDLKLYYHEDIDRWTVGSSPIPHGSFEAEEDARCVLNGLIKARDRAERMKASKKEENQNERRRHPSGCTGVTWNCTCHKWQACICWDGKIKVKYFKDLRDAVDYRHKMAAAKKRHDAGVKKAYAKRVAKDKAETRAWKEKKRAKRRLSATLYHDILAERKKY